jgi:DNA-binding transcriptional ArsR family regulator
MGKKTIGRWPDVLDPARSFFINPEQTRTVWFEVKVPDTATSGILKGKVRLLQQQTLIAELPVKITVFDFALPKVPHLRTDVGMFFGNALAMAKKHGFKGKRLDLNIALAENLLAHRMSPRGLPVSARGNLKEYEKWLKRYIEAGANVFNIQKPQYIGKQRLKEVEKLHEKYESECSAVFSEIRSGKYDKLYSSAGFHPASHNEITVSISILQPDCFIHHVETGSCRLIAGIRHTDTLIRTFDEDSIDLDRFLDNFGNEIRRLILEALAENGEMTASDLSRTTGIPVTTVLRHIEVLTEDYLLSVSRRKGLQIFYMLNREYIDKARRKMDRYLTKLSGIE